MRRSIRVPLLFTLLALSACSGGGDGKSRPAPSAAPTGMPSASPTVKPSLQPTPAPTPVPSTVAPTLQPSSEPSATPLPEPVGRSWQVAGSVSILGGNRIDSDTNDEGSSPVSNNEPGTAQVIPNAGRVGGYVASPGAGPEGPLQAGGDVFDAYRVNLLQGQYVTLHIADPDRLTGDLDLWLVDLDLNLVAVSENAGDVAIESLQAPVSASYYVVVLAYEDADNGIASASNYVLQVSDTALSDHLMSSQIDFVAGEVVVAFDDARLTKAQTEPDARARQLGLLHLGGAPGRSMRFGFDPVEQKSTQALPLGVRVAPALQRKRDTLRRIKALSARPDVRYAEPNPRRYLRAIPNDPFYEQQWHYPLINLPQAWDLTAGSADVLVAVIDSGVLIGHPDLVANLDPNDPDGVDFISPLDIANDGNGADENADDSGDAENPDGSASFHGTHVAGTIAAASDNGVGVSGVCWRCKIMPLRALGVGGGTGFDIDQAVRYAAGLPNDYGVAPVRPAAIINMSLGGGGFSRSEQETFTQVRDAGVLVVASAGNSGTSRLEYPASYDGVVSVGAVGPDRKLAGYSQFNAQVDVVGPGGNAALGRSAQVASTLGFGRGAPADVEYGYAFYQGTSMSSPHVAGVAGLMKSLYPGLTPQQFDAALADGSIVDEAGEPGRDDRYGFGIINAFKAVRHAQALASGESAAEAPQLAISPAAINFGSAASVQDVQARNVGTGTLEVTRVDISAAPWLTVTDLGGGSYRLQADRAVLPVGVSDGRVVFESSVNTVELPVRIEVVDAQAVVSNNAGHHYILLIPATDPESALQVEADPVDGEYAFRFDDVPEGDYYLVAGTDMDNDFSVCDDGEACALYPVSGDLQPVRVDQDLQDIRFATGFEVSFQQLSAQSAGGGDSAGPEMRAWPRQ